MAHLPRGRKAAGPSRAEFLRGATALGIGASGLGALLTACGTGGDGGEGGAASGPIELTVSHWPTLLYSTPWAAALEQGFFQDEGIDITGIVGSSGGGTTVRNVVTGGIPLGVVATPASVNAYQAGAPLQIVAGAIQNTSEINFVTLPDRKIKSIEDVRGKRVGFTNPGSVTQALAVLCLEEAGIDPASEVELQAMGGLSEALTGLKEGAIDVAPHLLPTFLMQKDEDWQVVFWTDEFVSNFMQEDLIAGIQPVERNPELIGTLVKIYQRGVEFTVAEPDEAAAAWSKNSEVSEEAARESLRTIDPAKYYGTALSADGLNTAVRAMKAIELLPADATVDWEGIIDQQFLPEDKRVDLAQLQ